MLKRKSLILVACSIVILISGAYGQNCPATQSKDVCALNTIFSSFYRSCKLPFPPKLKKPRLGGEDTVSVPAVPTDLVTRIQQLNLTDIQVEPTLSLMRVLSEVRPSKDLAGSIDNFIGETASASPEDFRQVGFTGEIYSTSCEAVISEDMKASGGGSFGPTDLSGSLDAAVKLNNQSGLFFTKGRFDSPLYSWLHRQNGALYADILMLAWRGLNNDLTTDRYYLAHATGFTATQLTTQDLYANATAASHIGVGFVPISFTNDFSLNGSNETKQDQNSYYTVFSKPDATNDYEKIPSSADLQSQISKYGLLPPISISPRQLQHTGDVATVVERVDGIPNDVCNTLGGWSWSVTDAVATQDSWDVSAAGLIAKTSPDSIPGLPQCEFTLYVKSAKDQTQFTAEPLLTAANSNGTTFTLKMPVINFSQGAYPMLFSAQSTSATPSLAPDQQTLTYSLALKAIQAPSGNGYTNVAVNSPTIDLKCGTQALSLSPDNQSITISQTNVSPFSLAGSLNYTALMGTPDLADHNMIPCDISKGSVILTSTAMSDTLTKDIAGLGLKLSLPRIKPSITFDVTGPATAVAVSGNVGSINNADVLASLKGRTVSLLDGLTQLASATLTDTGTFTFNSISVPAGTHAFSVAISQFGVVEGLQSDKKAVSY